MERQRLKSILETFTNVAVLLVAIAALCTFAANYLINSSAPALHVGLQRGKLLAQIPNVNYSGSKQTLLIALNTNCQYCRESIPFYQNLVAANSQPSKELQIVAIFPNRSEEVAEFIKGTGLKIHVVPEIQLGTLNISGTPSIILVNSSGEIDDFWVGKLGAPEGEHLMRSLRSVTVY